MIDWDNKDLAYFKIRATVIIAAILAKTFILYILIFRRELFTDAIYGAIIAAAIIFAAYATDYYLWLRGNASAKLG